MFSLPDFIQKFSSKLSWVAFTLAGLVFAGLITPNGSPRAQGFLVERGVVLSMGAGAPFLYRGLDDYYDGVFTYGGSASTPSRFFPDFMLLKLDLSGALFSHTLKEGSGIQLFQASLGPLLYYESSNLWKPYASVSFQGSVISSRGVASNTTERYLKPGARLGLGNQFYFGNGVGMRLEVSGNYIPVTDSSLHFFSTTAAITYDFGAAQTERLLRRAEASRQEKEADFDEAFQAGVRAVKDKDVKAARSAFRRAALLRPEHLPTQKYARTVDGLEKFLLAEKLYQSGQYYRAIPLYEKAAATYTPATEALASVRRKLSGRIKSLLSRGEAHFSAGRYGRCVTNMRRILLIEPGNNTAKIYLNRAIKRRQALSRLR